MDIEYVAQLARIELTQEEKQTYGNQLEQVLDYFRKLDEFDVEGIEPTAHAFPVDNVWDEDEPEAPLSAQDALNNAPAQSEGQFQVPRVVES